MIDSATTELAFGLPKRDVAAQALARVEPELLALEPTSLRHLSVDVPSAVAVVLGALPRLAAHRDEIVRALPNHPVEALDALGDYALATYYAHLLTLPAPRAESERGALVEEARPLRAALLVAAEALADRSLLSPPIVSQIRSGHGNLDLAGDLIALSALFAEGWEALHDKTAVSVEEVERAGELGATLLLEFTQEREALPAGLTAADLRARAFTLLADAYDECRRAVAYLRYHEGDASSIAPSMFARAPRRTPSAAAGAAAPADAAQGEAA